MATRCKIMWNLKMWIINGDYMIGCYYKIKLNEDYSNGDLIIYGNHHNVIGFVKEPFNNTDELVNFYFDYWERCDVVNIYDELLVDEQVKELRDD